MVGIVGIYAGFLVARYYYRRAKRDAAAEKRPTFMPLIDWHEFYQGSLKADRLKSRYVALRREGGKSRDPLKELREAQATDADIVALCGGGGFGKSRLLVELAKDNVDLRFANVNATTQDLKALMALLGAALQRGQWFALDDLQKFPGLGRLLGDLLAQTKARLLVACRDPDEVRELKQDQRFKTVVVNLGRMENVADVVRATGRNAGRIWDISHGIPAIAELAARYGDLSKIASEWDLLDSITNDMAAEFGVDGRQVLA